MPQTTLTEITLRALKSPEAGQIEYWDKSLSGFGVRVSQGGTKTFTLLFGTPRQRVTIGRYPIISLAEARAEAKRILAERTLGKRRPKAVAWEDAHNAFVAECEQRVKGRNLKDRTLNDYRRLLTKYFSFGRRQLTHITAEDIARRIDRITDAPSECNHALVAVKVFLRWAQKPPRRYIAHNPCEGMAPTKRPARKRVLTDKELKAVYTAALEGNDTFSLIVALLTLTGQRRGEIGALRWSWIDDNKRTITLPDFITKNKTEHTIPYGGPVASILRHLKERPILLPDPIPTNSAKHPKHASTLTEPEVEPLDYLFPASRSHVRGKPTTTFNGWPKYKKTFDERCGVSNWTLHDLRRTFATNLAALKVPPHIVERLLNHKFGSLQNQTDGTVSAVAEVYNRHLYLEEMRAAISLWEARLSALATAQYPSATRGLV